MTSRIFPTTKSKELENSSVVRTIDTDKLSNAINKFAGIEPSKISKTAAKKTDEKKKPKRILRQKGDCPKCGVPHPCSCDVIEAQKAGDHQKVASLMKIRANRRMAQIENIERTIVAKEEEDLKLRTAFRSSLFNHLQKLANKETSAGVIPGVPDGTGPYGGTNRCPFTRRKRRPVKKVKIIKKVKKAKDQNVEEACVSPEKFSFANRAKFAKYAELMGWPEEYVIAMTSTPAVSFAIPEATKLVLSNINLEKENKKKLIVAMHKEAKLAPEQASRIKKYWAEELGYQDTEWINDLVEEPSGK
jgi:hypothetical protein